MDRELDNDQTMSGVASVDRALLILTAFRRDDPSLGLAELTRRTGLVKSTVLRLAASLEKFCLLKKKEDGNYRLDVGVLRLASVFQEQTDLTFERIDRAMIQRDPHRGRVDDFLTGAVRRFIKSLPGPSWAA